MRVVSPQHSIRIKLNILMFHLLLRPRILWSTPTYTTVALQATVIALSQRAHPMDFRLCRPPIRLHPQQEAHQQ